MMPVREFLFDKETEAPSCPKERQELSFVPKNSMENATWFQVGQSSLCSLSFRDQGSLTTNASPARESRRENIDLGRIKEYQPGLKHWLLEEFCYKSDTFVPGAALGNNSLC